MSFGDLTMKCRVKNLSDDPVLIFLDAFLVSVQTSAGLAFLGLYVD